MCLVPGLGNRNQHGEADTDNMASVTSSKKKRKNFQEKKKKERRSRRRSVFEGLTSLACQWLRTFVAVRTRLYRVLKFKTKNAFFFYISPCARLVHLNIGCLREKLGEWTRAPETKIKRKKAECISRQSIFTWRGFLLALSQPLLMYSLGLMAFHFTPSDGIIPDPPPKKTRQPPHPNLLICSKSRAPSP